MAAIQQQAAFLRKKNQGRVHVRRFDLERIGEQNVEDCQNAIAGFCELARNLV